eukprot:539565-Pleurochrysis_carterae.AAC.1
MWVALNHLSWNRAATCEVPPEAGSAHQRWVIQQGSARRREPGSPLNVALEDRWVGAASGFVLRESQLVAERASHVHEHVAVSVSEGGFERCAELAAFGVGRIVSLEQRFDPVRVKGPVVVMVVVRPQLVGSIGVILSVGCVHRRSYEEASRSSALASSAASRSSTFGSNA